MSKPVANEQGAQLAEVVNRRRAHTPWEMTSQTRHADADIVPRVATYHIRTSRAIGIHPCTRHHHRRPAPRSHSHAPLAPSARYNRTPAFAVFTHFVPTPLSTVKRGPLQARAAARARPTNRQVLRRCQGAWCRRGALRTACASPVPVAMILARHTSTHPRSSLTTHIHTLNRTSRSNSRASHQSTVLHVVQRWHIITCVF